MRKLDCFIGAKSVALIVHIDPDTDALASAVVFRNFLKTQFKIRRVEIFAEFKKLDENLLDVIEGVEINKGELVFDRNPNSKQFLFDIAVIMDAPNIARVGKFVNIFNNAKLKMNIDHHDTNSFKADKKFVKTVSSTCEIIYQLFKPYKYQMSNADKGKIYAGIITDTDNFSVGAIAPATFKIVSEIYPYVEHDKIYNHFFCNNSLRNMQLLSKAIDNVVTFNHGKIVISHITKEQAKLFKATDADYIGISNRLAGIAGCKLMCFSRPKDGQYYVSMRSRNNGGDVGAIALKNGGGGHKGASAFNSDQDLAEIEQSILQEFTKTLSKTKQKKEKIF